MLKIIPSLHIATIVAAVALTAVFVSKLHAASSTEQPTGWASEQGGTTGGAGGTVVTVDNIDSLMKYAKMKNTPYIIFLKGIGGVLWHARPP